MTTLPATSIPAEAAQRLTLSRMHAPTLLTLPAAIGPNH